MARCVSPARNSYLPPLALLTKTVVGISVLGCVASAEATTLYVSTNGADSPSCGTQSAPCRSPDYAVTKAVSGDTIRIAGGTYFFANVANACDGTSIPSAVVCVVDKSITILGGYSPSTWVFDPVANHTVIDGGNARRGVFVGSSGGLGMRLTMANTTIQNGRALAHRELRAGRLVVPREEDAAAMLAAASELTAAAGYERYEISNWARPGRRCRHNLDCWSLGEYRGFGAGAHSFLRRPGPLRLANERDPAAYARMVRGRGDAVALHEEPAPRQLAGEAAMPALRTPDGIDEAAFAAAHGAPWERLFPGAAALANARGWLERAGGRSRLTPEGMQFSDAIFRLLF